MGMDILADVLDRVHLGGTLLFHYELGRPWSLALPAFPDAVFHYLNRGSATLALEKGRKLRMVQGDFVVVILPRTFTQGGVATSARRY